MRRQEPGRWSKRQIKSVRTLSATRGPRHEHTRRCARSGGAEPSAPVARNLAVATRPSAARTLCSCARYMRRAPLHWLAHNLVASQATSGVGRRAEPSCRLFDHTCDRAALPGLSTLLAAPNAPPFGPPDDGLVEADHRGAVPTDSNAAAATRDGAASRAQDADGLELLAPASARRASAPPREEAVQIL